jgi:hypothetical protein
VIIVLIKAGPFARFTGKVEGINQSKSLLKVNLNIFGATQVEVSFLDAEKLDPPGASSAALKRRTISEVKRLGLVSTSPEQQVLPALCFSTFDLYNGLSLNAESTGERLPG